MSCKKIYDKTSAGYKALALRKRYKTLDFCVDPDFDTAAYSIAVYKKGQLIGYYGTNWIKPTMENRQ